MLNSIVNASILIAWQDKIHKRKEDGDDDYRKSLKRFKEKPQQKNICQGRRHQQDESIGVWQTISWHRIATYLFGDFSTERELEVLLDSEKEESEMAFTTGEVKEKYVF